MKSLALTLAAALALAGCSEQAPPSGGAAPKVVAGPLQRIFQPEMIGATLPYLEQFSGPPRNISADGLERTYKVDRCEFTAYVAQGANPSISALRFAIAPGCDGDLSLFLGATPGASSLLSELTFAKFEAMAGFGVNYYADCLSLCGNAADPSVYAYWEGPRSVAFLQVMLEVVLVDDASNAAAEQWRGAMAAQESEDWIIDTRFNCTPEKYGDVARKAFAAVKPTAITLGHGLPAPRCDEAAAPALQSPAGSAQVRVPQPASACDYDYDKTLQQSGLTASRSTVHGPVDKDFAGYGCPYRITPAPGTPLPRGATVSYRAAYEGG